MLGNLIIPLVILNTVNLGFGEIYTILKLNVTNKMLSGQFSSASTLQAHYQNMA